MYLSTLLQVSSALPDIKIQGLSLNSQVIAPGELFIALAGTKDDGKKYIHQAIEKGAVAILTENPHDGVDQVPIIQLPDLRDRLGQIAAIFYGEPSNTLPVYGITGTSGKTSCAYFLADCLNRSETPCGFIGTLGQGYLQALKNFGLTTPDAISLQKSLANFMATGAKAVAMEVSSHGIHQKRIAATRYKAGVFTNLSQDHLDYHGDMETYALVKKSFLMNELTETAIINIDDDHGDLWAREITHKPSLTYSLRKDIADVYAAKPIFKSHGIIADIHSPWGNGQLTLPLLGAFNLSNALAVMCILGQRGYSLNKILELLNGLRGVPGRMQPLSFSGKPTIIIDYAHKPDALLKALKTCRAHTQGKLFCVFGCGGERDRGKRPMMAKIAEQEADHIILTNDNPRHEPPQQIFAEICQGFEQRYKVVLEPNRSIAIQKSIQWATSDDLILIAGKGAETYQIFGDALLPFSDYEEAKIHLMAK